MVSKVFPLFFVLIFITCSIEAEAKEAEELYQACVVCHGASGQGNKALKAPALSHQKAWYIQSQLKAFKSDIRGAHPEDSIGRQMLVFAKSLSEQEIELVANYISEFKVDKSSKQLKKDGKGYSAYQARCGACHGSEAKGNKAFKAPSLAVLSASYLQRQMDNFTHDKRGYKPQDKRGKQMAMMAKSVPEHDLKLIIDFLSQ